LDCLVTALVITYFLVANTKLRKLAPFHSLSARNELVLIEKRSQMELFIISLILLVALDLAALLWGFDSRDWIDSH
jgi:hypothetical protein